MHFIIWPIMWVIEISLVAIAIYNVQDECPKGDERDESVFVLWMDLGSSIICFLTSWIVFSDKGKPRKGLFMFVFVFFAVLATISSSIALGILRVTCLKSDAYYFVLCALILDIVATAASHAVKKPAQISPSPIQKN